MPAFEYQAVDSAGKTRKGVMQGDSARQVRQQLRQQQLLPIQIESVTQSREKAVGTIQFGTRLRASEQALMLRQLSTLLRSGQPLTESLQALTHSQQPVRIRRTLSEVRSRVLEGQSLAAAMQSTPRQFPEMMTAAIAAGERAGKLPAVMQQLAHYAQQRDRLGRNTLLALLYPLLLAVMSLLVIAGLVTYVVPRVVTVFDNFSQALPWPTRVLMAVSDNLRANWGWLLLLGLLLLVVGWWVWRNTEYRARIQGWLLKVPTIGRLLKAREAAYFTRTMSILLASAVPMVDALRVSTRVALTQPVKSAIATAGQRVREGASLSAALRQGNWLPPVVLQLIQSGEQSGDLPELLDQAADIQEQDLDAAIGFVTNLAQPVLILLVGIIVLFIVLAIMLPILDLNTLVGG